MLRSSSWAPRRSPFSIMLLGDWHSRRACGRSATRPRRANMASSRKGNRISSSFFIVVSFSLRDWRVVARPRASSAGLGSSERGRPGRSQAVRFHQGIERRAADAEQLGGGRQRAAAVGQRLLQHVALGAQPGRAQIEIGRLSRAGCEFQIGGIDQPALGHDHRALHAGSPARAHCRARDGRRCAASAGSVKPRRLRPNSRLKRPRK